MSRCFLILLCLVMFTRCQNREGTTYYFDHLKGNDQYKGTSPSKPWKSLEKIEETELKPGDRILLKSGQEFQGTMHLKNVIGSIDRPVLLGSWGQGMAVINSADSAALIVDNASYFICRNLELKGSGRLKGNKADGFCMLKGYRVTIDSLEISGYFLSGLHISGGNQIEVSHVYSHDNGFSFIYAESGEKEYGPDGTRFKTLRYIQIKFCVAENNPGCPAITDNHSGNGILMAGAVSGRISYCEAMNNGWDMPREGNGPVGIWAYMCDSIVIDHCFSHNNKTSPKGKDGGGFDFDGGIRYSVMEYNISAYNEGAGYGIFQYAGATSWSDNIIRYNISYNDGSKNSKSGILMWCDPAAKPMKNFHAYNNTVVTGYEHGISFEPGNYNGFLFENNIFMITGNQHNFIDGKFEGADFSRNCYWSDNMPSGIGLDSAAVLKNPLLHLPPDNSTFQREAIRNESWFSLKKGSPCNSKGNIIANNGGKDFNGDPLPDNNSPNLGAIQGQYLH